MACVGWCIHASSLSVLLQFPVYSQAVWNFGSSHLILLGEKGVFSWDQKHLGSMYNYNVKYCFWALHHTENNLFELGGWADPGDLDRRNCVTISTIGYGWMSNVRPGSTPPYKMQCPNFPRINITLEDHVRILGNVEIYCVRIPRVAHPPPPPLLVSH